MSQSVLESPLEQGQAFLKENAKKPGVITTPSGLQYTIIKPGTGKSPTVDTPVYIHARGWLLDGTEFDSTHGREAPLEKSLKFAPKGWREGLPLMKEGAIFKFFIPSQLAFGHRGAMGSVGPDEVVIYEIELFEVR